MDDKKTDKAEATDPQEVKQDKPADGQEGHDSGHQNKAEGETNENASGSENASDNPADAKTSPATKQQASQAGKTEPEATGTPDTKPQESISETSETEAASNNHIADERSGEETHKESKTAVDKTAKDTAEKSKKASVSFPDFSAGDTITVYYKIREGNKERIQQYQGVVIQRKGSGSTATFTVRKISSGIGVERIFPIASPFIDRIDINRRGKVRRARIYYLRNRKGKSARIKEKR